MFCKKCGSRIPEGARFCRECGEPVPEIRVPGHTPGQGAGQAQGQTGLVPQRFSTTSGRYSAAGAGPNPVYAGGYSASARMGGTLDQQLAGRFTVRDAIVTVLALVLVICMFCRWVTIPVGDIAEEVGGGLVSSSDAEDMGSIAFTILGLADGASILAVTVEDELDDMGVDLLTGGTTFLAVVWVIGILTVTVGATLRVCGKKPYVLLAGCGICLLLAIVTMVGCSYVNGQINSEIASMLNDDPHVTWVKVTGAPVVALIVAVLNGGLAVFDLVSKK